MTDDTRAALEDLQARFSAMQEQFEIYKTVCEKALLAESALRETTRQSFQMMLTALLAGNLGQVVGFLQERLATMEADRQQLNA